MKKILNSKYLFYIILILGCALFAIAVINISSHKITGQILVIISFLFFGSSGIPLIVNKRIGFGFVVFKGIFVLIYGVFFLVIGVLGAIAFSFTWFFK